MVIEKSIDYGRSWVPLQYYSSQCRKVYGKPLNAAVTRENEQEALCSDAHTQHVVGVAANGAASLGGAGDRVAFAMVEGRPSGFDFETSPVLQVEWNFVEIQPNKLLKFTMNKYKDILHHNIYFFSNH